MLFDNVILLLKSVCQFGVKGHDSYYYNILLEKVSYELTKK